MSPAALGSVAIDHSVYTHPPIAWPAPKAVSRLDRPLEPAPVPPLDIGLESVCIHGMDTAVVHDLAREYTTDCACFKVRHLARLITKAYDEALRPAGLRTTQLAVLSAVALANGMLMLTELARALGMDRTTLSRNLRPLERRGLVALSGEGYRRARTVELTDTGEQVLAEALPLWRNAQERFRNAIGPDEWVAFHAHVDLFARAS